jgi:hypothetical protein
MGQGNKTPTHNDKYNNGDDNINYNPAGIKLCNHLFYKTPAMIENEQNRTLNSVTYLHTCSMKQSFKYCRPQTHLYLSEFTKMYK